MKNADLSSFLNESLLQVQAISPVNRENGLNVYSFCTKSKKKDLAKDILPYIARGQLETPSKATIRHKFSDSLQKIFSDQL